MAVWRLRVGAAQTETRKEGVIALLVLGSWVGVWRLFHHSLFLTASRVVLTQDPSTRKFGKREKGVFGRAVPIRSSDVKRSSSMHASRTSPTRRISSRVRLNDSVSPSVVSAPPPSTPVVPHRGACAECGVFNEQVPTWQCDWQWRRGSAILAVGAAVGLASARRVNTGMHAL